MGKAENINTYSAGFEVEIQQKKYNLDSQIAKRTAEKYGTNHHEVFFTNDDAIKYFDKTVYHLDEPIMNYSALTLMKLSKEAKKKVSVVLTGDGGDEVFSGYHRYRNDFLIDKYQKLPNIIKKPAKYIAKTLKDDSLGIRLETKNTDVQRYLNFHSAGNFQIIFYMFLIELLWPMV